MLFSNFIFFIFPTLRLVYFIFIFILKCNFKMFYRNSKPTETFQFGGHTEMGYKRKFLTLLNLHNGLTRCLVLVQYIKQKWAKCFAIRADPVLTF